jgi:hypothetical protein
MELGLNMKLDSDDDDDDDHNAIAALVMASGMQLILFANCDDSNGTDKRDLYFMAHV